MDLRIFVMQRKNLKESSNVNLLIVVMFFYLLICYSNLPSEIIGIVIPMIVVSVLYFFIACLIYRCFHFLVLMFIPFFFLVIFLSFKNTGTISMSSIHSQFIQRSLPTILYSLLLIPFVFLGITLDFYALPYETRGILKRVIATTIMPILLRRELLKRRFHQIQESLYSRGINSKAFLGKYRTLRFWMIPLVVTMLFEGAHSGEYNEMLKTNIAHYTSSQKIFYINFKQKALISFLFLAFVLRGIIWINMLF